MKRVRFSHKQRYRRQNYGGVSERSTQTWELLLGFVQAVFLLCVTQLLIGLEWLYWSIMKALSLILFLDVLWRERDGWDVEAKHDGLYETACWLKHLLFLACLLSLSTPFFQRQVVLPWKCISRKKSCSYFPLRWTIYFSSVCLKLFKWSVSCDSIAVNFL